jgi:hypothetical protein
MPIQASTDQDLARAGSKQRGLGVRLLAVAAVLLAVGLLLQQVESNRYVSAAGLALCALAAPIALGGTALLASGLVAGRASERKPFA